MRGWNLAGISYYIYSAQGLINRTMVMNDPTLLLQNDHLPLIDFLEDKPIWRLRLIARGKIIFNLNQSYLSGIDTVAFINDIRYGLCN